MSLVTNKLSKTDIILYHPDKTPTIVCFVKSFNDQSGPDATGVSSYAVRTISISNQFGIPSDTYINTQIFNSNLKTSIFDLEANKNGIADYAIKTYGKDAFKNWINTIREEYDKWLVQQDDCSKYDSVEWKTSV